MGAVNREALLRLVYSAGDVMVVHSRMETFSLTSIEAQACGTPVVAFRASGVQETITHQESGYLAKPFEVESLLEGIEYCLKNRKEMSKNALRNVEDRFTIELMVERYTRLYHELINDFNPKSDDDAA